MSSKRLARELGFERVATGTNCGRRGRPVPPRVSVPERSAACTTPLRDAALTKAEVRRIARRWGPADLGQTGDPVPGQQNPLRRRGSPVSGWPGVDRAEAGVARRIGSRRPVTRATLRVRDLGECVRVEVDAALASAVAVLPAVFEAVAAAGFGATHVAVDAFRSRSAQP